MCKLYDGLNACSSRVITITVNISPDKPSKMVCPEVAALKNYEEEIVDSLLYANLDCLCREALEIGVIPQNVRDDVRSIDWQGLCATPKGDQVPTDACIQGDRRQPKTV